MPQNRYQLSMNFRDYNALILELINHQISTGGDNSKHKPVTRERFEVRIDDKKCEHRLEVHNGIYCDGCNKIIVGPRYQCLCCDDFDFCSRCFENFTIEHDDSHKFHLHFFSVYPNRVNYIDCINTEKQQLYIPSAPYSFKDTECENDIVTVDDHGVYDVEKLWNLTNNLPIVQEPIHNYNSFVHTICTRKSCQSCEMIPCRLRQMLNYPILVREDVLDIIDGMHRLRYCHNVGMSKISVRLVPEDVLKKCIISDKY